MFTFRAKSRFVFGRKPFAALLTNAVVNPRNQPTVAAITADRGCKVFCFTLGGGIVTGLQTEKLRIFAAEVGQVTAYIFVFAVCQEERPCPDILLGFACLRLCKTGCDTLLR